MTNRFFDPSMYSMSFDSDPFMTLHPYAAIYINILLIGEPFLRLK